MSMLKDASYSEAHNFSRLWLNIECDFHYSQCIKTSKWRHNERDGVPSHRRLDCVPNRLFRCKSKNTSNSALLAFVMRIHRWPVNFLHIRPVTLKMLPFNDVAMRKRSFRQKSVLSIASFWIIVWGSMHNYDIDLTVSCYKVRRTSPPLTR